MAVIPELVPTEALPSANSLRSVSSRGAAILGPAVGGLLVAVGGVSLAFTLDAISFVIAAACVVGLAGVPALRQAGQRSTSALEEIRDGFRTVASTPWLWITIVIAAVSNLALAGPLAAALPLLVKVDLGSDSRGYALLQSLFATGAFCGAMWMGRATRLRRRGITIYAAWFVAAVALTILGLSGSLVIAGLAILIIGLSETMFGLVWTNALQTSVPSDRLGRVASLDALGSFALLPVAYALAGFAADRVGPGPVFVIGGIVGGLIIALGFLHPGVRALD
jgi:MFS family permease